MDIVGLVIDGAIDSELSHGQTFDRIMVAMYELYSDEKNCGNVKELEVTGSYSASVQQRGG